MSTGRLIIGIIIILLGLSFLLGFNLFRILIPLLIIYLGIKVLSHESGKIQEGKTIESNENYLDRVLVFFWNQPKIFE